MARGKKAAPAFDEQVYKLPQYGGAIVTVRYEVDNPPPFFQPGPGVVIIGEHACGHAYEAQTFDVPDAPPRTAKRGGNLPLSEDDPRYQALKRNLAAVQDEPPVKKVLTSEDVWREATGQTLEPGTIGGAILGSIASGE